MAHGELAKEWYDQHPELDPKRSIEPIVSATEEPLITLANGLVGNTDNTLFEHSTQEHVHARIIAEFPLFQQSAIVLLPVAASNPIVFLPFYFPNVSEVGDPRLECPLMRTSSQRP